MTGAPLRARWLGRVLYQEAWALQRALCRRSADDYLLLLEHPHVYTLGVRADPAHVLVDPASVGAELVRTDRGGDVTYHGPGQLVGYPILSVPREPGSGPAHVRQVEQVVIDTLVQLGLPASTVGRLDGYPGVWVGVDGTGPPRKVGKGDGPPRKTGKGDGPPRKIAAIGVRTSRGRTMHGFALNVRPDLAMFGHIVPCGIPDKAVTSLFAEGITVTMADVVDATIEVAARCWGPPGSPVQVRRASSTASASSHGCQRSRSVWSRPPYPSRPNRSR